MTAEQATNGGPTGSNLVFYAVATDYAPGTPPSDAARASGRSRRAPRTGGRRVVAGPAVGRSLAASAHRYRATSRTATAAGDRSVQDRRPDSDIQRSGAVLSVRDIGDVRARATEPEGFTLIEMAVVLVVVALILGSILVPLNAQVRQRNVAETQRMLERNPPGADWIRDDQRAPAAAREVSRPTERARRADQHVVPMQPTQSHCTGFVPWTALGTPRSDAWGKMIGTASTRTMHGEQPYSRPVHLHGGSAHREDLGPGWGGVRSRDQRTRCVLSRARNLGTSSRVTNSRTTQHLAKRERR